MLKIQFDAHQPYQIDAVMAVVDVFEGQPVTINQSSLIPGPNSGVLFSEFGVGNNIVFDEDVILRNVQDIQKRNGIPESASLAGAHFSVEMETGTGKTYVYLRTIRELNSRYGFKKFVIVVPTVAIREGVQKTIEITRDHFSALYPGVPAENWIYDSDHLSRLRQFAASDQIQILIINIDAFNKPTNVIFRNHDNLAG